MEEIKNILKELQDRLWKRELDCLNQMAYMSSHNFNMEREALQYKKDAYSDCRDEVLWAQMKIDNLLKKSEK